MKSPVRSASKGLCGALVKSWNDGGNGMFQRPLWWLTGTIWLVACSGGTEPGIRPCTGGTPVNLAVTQYVSLDAGVDSGCVEFPATTSIVEYLMVPQLATGTPGQMTSFVLGGDTIRPPAPAPPMAMTGAGEGSAERFHAFLRIGDERRSWGFAPEPPPRSPVIAPSPAVITSGPPALNSLRTFMACAKLDCSRFDKVGARVRALKSKVAIYVDTLAPAGGPDSTALDSIARVFDQRLYAVDTAAFGRESDIDSNTVVLVLMTNTVNKLVSKTTCQNSGFVAGFFFGFDLDPRYGTDPHSNKGEVFYSIVADPAGTLSCSHTAAEVQSFVPVTFIHEFQHMISFNQHVLVGGSVNGEVLWLNEGFSHYAEELGGRSYEVTPTARISDCTIGTITCRFYGGNAGNLQNAYTYLDSTSKHFLEPTSGLGTLAERGAAWLFVRYVVDRYSAGNTMADWNALTRAMVSTTNTGAANIAAATGDPFTTVVSRWALANWVSDLPAFVAPAALKYDSWSFRSTYASLHAQRPGKFPNAFPLVPSVSAGRDVSRNGTLLAGSGVYDRATQSPGDPGFTLSFTAPSGAVIDATKVPRLNVIRIQ